MEEGRDFTYKETTKRHKKKEALVEGREGIAAVWPSLFGEPH